MPLRFHFAKKGVSHKDKTTLLPAAGIKNYVRLTKETFKDTGLMKMKVPSP